MIAKILKTFVDSMLEETHTYLKDSKSLYLYSPISVTECIKEFLNSKAEQELESYLKANFTLQDIIQILKKDEVIY